jgi:exodeoxyribonuclease VII small subunit
MAGKKKMTFESALARLDEIVRAMENGQAMLDESLSLYEEGIQLIQFCSKALDDAEQKVKILQKGDAGELIEKDFMTEEDSAK